MLYLPRRSVLEHGHALFVVGLELGRGLEMRFAGNTRACNYFPIFDVVGCRCTQLRALFLSV